MMAQTYLRQPNNRHHKLVLSYDDWNWTVIDKFNMRRATLGRRKLYVIYDGEYELS
jgi:hypothetical protein